MNSLRNNLLSHYDRKEKKIQQSYALNDPTFDISKYVS